MTVPFLEQMVQKLIKLITIYGDAHTAITQKVFVL